MQAIVKAYGERRAGDYATAILTLSNSLASVPVSQWQVQMFRDRAFCYKLARDWKDSIDDLTAAFSPGLNESVRSQILKDRAFAYVQNRDPELAFNDYEEALKINGDDSDARLGANTLQAIIRKPTTANPPFRVIVGANVSRSDLLPRAVQALQPKRTAFLSMGWWWNPIPVTELRYTDSSDKVSAEDIVSFLRAGGLDAQGPTLLTGPGRTRHFELWIASPQAH